MRCLVTGATGFVGSHLVEALVARGDEVTALLRPRSSRRWLERLPIRFALGSLDDPAALAAAVRDQDVVFHVAGVITALTKEEYFRTNVEGTCRLVEACRRAGVGLKRFLHVSSLAAAGPSRDDQAMDEAAPCRPVSPYGASKLAGERAVMSAGFPATAVRPPVVYGPRDQGLLPFFRTAALGLRAALGERKYVSTIYIDDLVAGILQAADAPAAAGRVYYLSRREILTYDDIGLAMARAVGARRTVRVRVPMAVFAAAASIVHAWAAHTGGHPMLTRFKVQEIRQIRWTCSPARAERELGFIPRVPIDEGAARTARWYRAQGWL
jgi:nucleoside-diphosphate-sugar epimerase